MKALIKYLKNRKASINTVLSKPRRKYTPDTFHKLRIEIKKLNALFDLMNYCSKDFKRKKTFKPFKLIFQQAGKVRELQLHEVMLRRYLTGNTLSNYRYRIKKIRLKEQDKFFLLMKSKCIKRLKKKYHVIAHQLNKINNKKAVIYLEKKKNLINKLLDADRLEPEQIHELRKRLKILNYSMKFLSLEKQDKQFLEKNIISGLIGKWHDCQVLTRHLEKAEKDVCINSNEINELEKVRMKIIKNSELLLSKINSAIFKHEHSE
ncbi:MAG: hypothetical protein RIR48_873 [Bacteroidota bacterium]|jgi:CHAD domain-containing protein